MLGDETLGINVCDKISSLTSKDFITGFLIGSENENAEMCSRPSLQLEADNVKERK